MFLDEHSDQPEQRHGTNATQHHQTVRTDVLGGYLLRNGIIGPVNEIGPQQRKVGQQTPVHQSLDAASATVFFALPMNTSSPIRKKGRLRKVYSSNMYLR